MMIGIS